MSYYDPDLNKNVLIQDTEQVSQTTKKARESRIKKDQADYDASVKQYEKDQKAAEEQYQKEVAEYNRKLAEAERVEKEKGKYDAEIQRLQAEKGKALSDAHYAVWGPGGSRNRSDLGTAQNTIAQNYDMAINRVIEQKRVVQGYEEFSALYPGKPIPSSIRKSFVGSPGLSIGSIAEKYYTGKAAKEEYDRQSSMQNARAAASYTPEQTKQIQAGSAGLLGTPTPAMKERAEAIKPTPNIITGKQAVETRRPLTGVKTVETIYGGQHIETNPRAFVAGLIRQNVDAAGRPTDPIQGKEGTQLVYSFQNISEVKDPSAIALLEFQSQLKTQTAPSAGVYKGILQERGLKETPLTKRIIETYSSKPVKEYKTRAEAFGLSEVRGQKGIISKDGVKLFNLQTGEGSIRIGRMLGYKYSKLQPISQVQGPPKPVESNYLLLNLNPPQKEKFDPIDEIRKSFGSYYQEINPQSKLNQNKLIDRSGSVEPINTLDIALIASPGGKIIGLGKTLEKGIIKVAPVLKPLETKVNKFLISKTGNILDAPIRKGFSYDITYKPSKRVNEIDLSDRGEVIGKYSEITARPRAATQKDVKIVSGKKTEIVKLDPTYKPRERFEGGFKDLQKDRGEIIGSNTPLSKSPIAKQSDIKLPIQTKIKPVQIDPFYKPAKRANEIDLSRDDILVDFTSKKVKLGKGRSRPSDILRGKKDKPVDEDYFYKPSKRVNEIDLDDSADVFKFPKKEQLKSEVQLDLKRELKRLKRTRPEFKKETLSFGGEGKYLAGKSGRQQLLQIQRQEQITKKKLITKRQTPVNLNWSEKIETTEIPKVGKVPITVIIPVKKQEQKKKPYLEQRQFVEAFEIQENKQRPRITSISTERFGQVSTPRLMEKIGYSTAQRTKLKTPQKMVTPQRYVQVIQPRTNIQFSRTTTRQAQKLTQPSPTKFPTRLSQPVALKPKQRTIQVLRSSRPPRNPITITIFKEPKEKPKNTKQKETKSEINFFLGNVPESQISGIFKRKEITLGKESITKTRRGDVRVLAGKKRETRKESKWFEGKKGDMFGFKNEAKKRKTKFF